MIKRSQAEQLLKDDTFIEVFDIIRKEQVKKFLESVILIKKPEKMPTL
tara:strand:- start:296 stop:439 length:144 start_codon:yes stop_codon:yes gene_type:complete